MDCFGLVGLGLALVECMKTATGWGTTTEINYLHSIRDKVHLIQGYIAGAKRRRDWGSIDGSRVIAAAERIARNGVAG